MIASIVVTIIVFVLIAVLGYATLVAFLYQRNTRDLERSYSDREFAKRCLCKFSVCTKVLESIGDTIKERLSKESKPSEC